MFNVNCLVQNNSTAVHKSHIHLFPIWKCIRFMRQQFCSQFFIHRYEIVTLILLRLFGVNFEVFNTSAFMIQDFFFAFLFLCDLYLCNFGVSFGIPSSSSCRCAIVMSAKSNTSTWSGNNCAFAF